MPEAYLDSEPRVVDSGSPDTSLSELFAEIDIGAEVSEPERVPEPIVILREGATMGEVARLKNEEASISGDIDDFFDENIIKEIGNRAEDYDVVNKRVEDLRSLYRGKHI